MNEARQMVRQGEIYYTQGSVWNVIDVTTSVFLLVASNAYFHNDGFTMRSTGAFGVFTKWLGGTTIHNAAHNR